MKRRWLKISIHLQIILLSRKNGRRYVNANFIDMSVPYAAGALYSTVEDLHLWDQALFGNQLLRKENMDLLFTKHIPSGGSYYYGYGWGVGEIRLGNRAELIETIGHGGGIDGFNTQLTRIPSDKSFIVLLNNTGGAPLDQMTNAIAAILYDKAYDLPKRSVPYSSADRIEKEGIAAALQYYNGIKDSIGYYLDEREMCVMPIRAVNLKRHIFLRTIFLATKKEENDKVFFSQANLYFALSELIYKFLLWPGEHKFAEGKDQCVKTEPRGNRNAAPFISLS